MGGGDPIQLPPVEGGGHHLALPHKDGADGGFVEVGGKSGLFQSQLHIMLVFFQSRQKKTSFWSADEVDVPQDLADPEDGCQNHGSA